VTGSIRIGILGGTFDPPHIGHLIVGQDLVEALDLHELLFVVSGEPPHKEAETVTAGEIRYRMVLAAVESNDLFRASDVEIRRDGPSYSVDTLRRLKEQHPGAELYFIIGADQFAELSTWRDPEEIARLAHLVVMTRGGEDPTRIDPGVQVSYETVPVTRVDVSSTGIRDRIRRGRAVRYLVRKPVRRIIAQEGLYEDEGDA
jgi:nicotinate-nucleotide adenylyltransferase